MSFPVTWVPPPASYSLVGSEMYSMRQFWAFYTHFQVTSGLMTSPPDYFRSPEVTWCHFLSRDCLLLRATALYEAKCTVCASFRPSTATSRWLPVKWRQFRVTSGHLRSRDVNSCHVTAFSCELQPCRKWNVQYAPVFGLIQPLRGDLRRNDVTLGHFRSPEVTDVISCHVTASSCELQPCRKWNLQYTQVLDLQPLPGDFRSNDVTSGSLPVIWGRDVTSCHVTASSCELQPCTKWNVQYTPVFGLLQPLPGAFRSNNVTSGSLPVIWLPPPARYSLVGSEMYSIRQFRPSTATSRWLSVKWRHLRVTSGQLRLRDVISCHVTASCELQPCKKSNVQYTPVFGLLQPLPGDFRSNDVTSGSLPVTWGHVTSFPVTWLPPHASYSLVGSEMHSIRPVFCLLQPLPGDFR